MRFRRRIRPNKNTLAGNTAYGSGMLLTWHNLQYYQELMAAMRAAIAEDRFATFEADFHARRAEGDVDPP